MAHVNLMADTVIANLPSDGLRAVMRSILAANPGIVPTFERNAKLYLERTEMNFNNSIFESTKSGSDVIEELKLVQSRTRAMLGCGSCFQSLSLFKRVVDQISEIQLDVKPETQQSLVPIFASLDGDLVQAVTAIEKVQINREISKVEYDSINALFEALKAHQETSSKKGQEFLLRRGLTAVAGFLGNDTTAFGSHLEVLPKETEPFATESFSLKGAALPRLFSGLWQLSSPSWGSVSQSEIFNRFSQNVNRGFTAYDMADHYGDAEILFGEFQRLYTPSEALFASTKICIFQKVEVTRALMYDLVTERCRRLRSDRVDLIQFHWQFYDDHQYVEALRLLQTDERVRLLGLCNFDSVRMEEILAAGVDVVSNQVQFSLIDSRPTVRMGKICEKYGVKLLTYGTLCGGFLTEKWLNKSEPEIYSHGITPSQRKYLGMINAWGGWALFQELLQTLKAIGDKHDASVSNVATRWVLDFPYVGAAILGIRMGNKDHTHENQATYGWQLDSDEREAIEQILKRSKRDEIFSLLGDCGGEYRI